MKRLLPEGRETSWNREAKDKWGMDRDTPFPFSLGREWSACGGTIGSEK